MLRSYGRLADQVLHLIVVTVISVSCLVDTVDTSTQKEHCHHFLRGSHPPPLRQLIHSDDNCSLVLQDRLTSSWLIKKTKQINVEPGRPVHRAPINGMFTNLILRAGPKTVRNSKRKIKQTKQNRSLSKKTHTQRFLYSAEWIDAISNTSLLSIHLFYLGLTSIVEFKNQLAWNTNSRKPSTQVVQF